MSKRLVLTAILIAVLVGVSSLSFKVQKVEASGTIYIRADGSIDPPTVPISTTDNVTYTFTGNVYDSIVVERDNIIIDGAGYNLQGAGEGGLVGIELSERRNVKVTNVTIQNFDSGIFSSSLCPSRNNSIVGIRLADIRRGISLEFSSNNTITGNVFTGCGLALKGSYGNLVEDNLVNGKPLVYLEGVSDYVVEDAGQVILFSCNNILVENLNLSYTNYAIQLGGTNNSIIRNNNIIARDIYVDRSILLFASSNNNSIVGNNIVNNSYGMWIESSSDNNSIVGNNIVNNSYGIFHGGGSHNNHIFHNNFINNTQQEVTCDWSSQFWDNGYPSGGNYWSDYNGTDLLKGPYQNLTGSDGVGDVPYKIPIVNDTRHTIGFAYASYSLMAPISIFDAGTWNGVPYYVNVVSNSTVSNFRFNPEEGAFIHFNVTGEDGTSGFCRVTIPKSLLWVEDGWTITVGDRPISDYTIIPDENYTYVYFAYNHSTQTVIIQGTSVIPEFPSAIIMPLMMALTTLAVAVPKKRKPKT